MVAPVHVRDHEVSFYASDDELNSLVTGFVTDGLAVGDAVIVVATPAHRLALAQALAASGVDVDAARGSGGLVLLDAAATLASIMDGDVPDPDRFGEVAGDLMDGTAAGGRGVRAF